MPAPNQTNPTCQHCGSLLRKNGFTTAGLQMYRCSNSCSQLLGRKVGRKATGQKQTNAERCKAYRDRKKLSKPIDI